MAIHRLQLDQPRPFFAEVPYYLWGQVNYDSDGDCKKPTDRQWTCLYLQHRGTREVIDIKQQDDVWLVEGWENTAGRLALFLTERCGAKPSAALEEPEGGWDHAAAMLRAARVASEFAQPALVPFDSRLFWGSWKWIGWYATDFTWVGRFIMHAVVRNDPRAIPLCIDWLSDPPRFPEQEVALCYAVQRLSGEPARSGREWVDWYKGGPSTEGAKSRFPEPNFKEWLAELKAEFP